MLKKLLQIATNNRQ